MVLTEITSGLGNQLFQYAAGYGLAHLRRTTLRLDTRFFRASGVRPYELGRFSISGRELTTFDRLRYNISRPETAHRWSRRATRWLPVGRFNFIDDFDDSFHEAPDDTVLRGYWQSEGYFLHCEDDLRREFSFKDPPNAANAAMIARIGERPSVSLHVRRGDYLEPAGVLSPAPISYYEDAIAWLRARVPDARFFVFGDDPDWNRNHIKIADATYVTHNVGSNDPEDLRLMSCCDHFIIANSTFGWWGAWLSARPGKTVVAPRTWFSRPNANEARIVPDRWIRL